MAVTDQQFAELLEYCLGFAKQMIEKAGEFHPFGAEIGPLGKLQALGFWDGRENPPGAELYAYAQEILSHKAANDGILGGAIAANVNIPPQFESDFPDGIRVQIEAENYSRLIYLPYRVSQSGWLKRKTEIEYGELFAVEIEPAFFRPAAE